MERINRIIIFIGLLPVLLFGCKEEGRIDHIDENAPAPVQIDRASITVQNTPGGAVLKYTVPKDENLLYVRAECEIRPGVIRENKSSYYVDSLVLEGFGEAREYVVKMYSVGKNEKASEPVSVTINPTTAPVNLTTAEFSPSFMGVAISIKNPLKADLAIVLIGDTAHYGYQTTLRTFYTAQEEALFFLRGLDTLQYDFSVYMCDLWDNISNTVEATVTPWFEEEIPKDTWQEYTLDNDAQPSSPINQYRVSYLWDNDRNSRSWIGFLGLNEQLFPQWITWDLGVTAVVSRFLIWEFSAGDNVRIYAMESPKIVELWGRADTPPQDGSWDGWLPLGTWDRRPPSGQLPPTAEDISYVLANGHECAIEVSEFAPNPFVPVRYLRFKTIETYWGPRLQGPIVLKEFDFFGTISR